ncbi:MAG: hypothetical protein Q9M33_12325 [Robiginitomaculum sp.]|nr:hypothetical protein [Robiginitomaculum sp.]MDQ7078426.1 hypothetical protein [Robiginitomaculum sp.]
MHKQARYRRDNHELIRFFAGHLVVGLIAGEGMLAGLLLLDVGGLRTMIWSSSDKMIALGLLIIFFALTFGSLAMGTGVMGLRNRNEEDKKKHKLRSDQID